jgi:HAD superfamily hydrolase (TIGR01509 family)
MTLKKQAPVTGPIKAILFDLDGTLIDSERAAAQAVRECFSEWGIRIPAEEAGFVTGRTWQVSLDHFEARFGLPFSKAETERKLLQRFREILHGAIPEIPGAREAVQSFAKQFPLGLVSGSVRHDILVALDQLQIRDRFRVILGAEDYPRSKPAPDGYQKALKELGVSGNEAVVFEDSAPGIESAEACGMRVVAVTCTNAQDPIASRAHARAWRKVSDLRGLGPDWLKS